MTRSDPSTALSGFIAALSEDRRQDFVRVREVIRQHLPEGYEEAISKNMLVYQVPLERYADTYNGHPLWYVVLASEKSYLSLHLMPVYGDPALARRLAEGFSAANKKLDMGKACLRFKSAESLALDVIGEIVAAIAPEQWIEIAKRARNRSKRDHRTRR